MSLLLAVVPAAVVQARQLDPAADTAVREALDIRTFGTQRLQARTDAAGDVRVEILLDDEPVELVLVPHSVRAPGFEVLTRDGAGRLRSVVPPRPATMRGVVAGEPQTSVTASVRGGRLRAIVTREDETWGIQPADEVLVGVDPALHLVYRKSETIPGDWSCGVDGMPRAGDAPPVAAASAGAACENTVEIAFDGDFEYFALNDSSVPNTVADIEFVLAAVNSIYERDVAITHAITQIIVQIAEPDPYDESDSSALLNQFRDHWNANHNPDAAEPVDRDIAHLMTGRSMAGNTIGRAWLNTICDSPYSGFGYGLSETLWTSNVTVRVDLTAHELGHNWSAIHCDGDGDCAVMCSIITGCDDVARFGAAATASISTFRDTRTCLTTEQPPANDCNINCIDDALEIADGIAGDCNLNGVPDDCDIADGLSGDCDLNGVPDVCEDCDGNGFADACDLNSTFEDDSGPISPFGFFTDATHTIVAPPAAAGDVTLEFRALGILNFGSHNVEVSLNGSDPPWVIFDGATGADCPTVSGPVQVVMTDAEFNALLGGGDATFTFHTAAGFLPEDCGGAWISVRTTYSAVTDLDGNANGILDVCECDADCESAGPDTNVDVGDLLDLLANWGTLGGGGCDIAPPGGDGVIDVGDLLELLGAWGTCAP